VKKALIPAVGAALAALVAVAVLYERKTPGGNQASACAGTGPVLAQMKPLAKGEVAAVQVPKTSQSIPNLAFKAPDGQPTSLASLQGKTLLVNLWATWCVPCRKEMPALDRLQQQLGGPDFQVVAINIDQRNLDRPQRFLDEIGVKALTNYADPEAKVFQDLQKIGRALGMPTTLIVDAKGCELAHLAGPAEWDSPDAVALIKAAMGQK
jgi:thiol-disulfide isomerase/thioredoxin